MMRVLVVNDAPARAAWEIASALSDAIAQRGTASLAVSGGSTGPPMLGVLAAADLSWHDIGIWQVDERVAPDGDSTRNANQLTGVPGRQHLMPVTAPDLAAAADEYAGALPDRFDVVHLGMGADGHTASWPPGDPVIDSPRLVDLSGEYRGRVRMTLTPHVIEAARCRVVLATGVDKAPAIERWLVEDADDLPISRVGPAPTIVVLDPAAASRIGTLDATASRRAADDA